MTHISYYFSQCTLYWCCLPPAGNNIHSSEGDLKRHCPEGPGVLLVTIAPWLTSGSPTGSPGLFIVFSILVFYRDKIPEKDGANNVFALKIFDIIKVKCV